MRVAWEEERNAEGRKPAETRRLLFLEQTRNDYVPSRLLKFIIPAISKVEKRIIFSQGDIKRHNQNKSLPPQVFSRLRQSLIRRKFSTTGPS